jgi:hypothetical protein
VTASPLPFAAGGPFFVEEKPLDGPRDNAIDNVFIRPPLIFDRIVNAQPGQVRSIPQSVDMLRRFAGAARIGADRRIDYEHAHVWMCETPALEIAASKVHNADSIRLTNWPQRSFPHTHPVAMRDEMKLRALGPQFLILLGDREGAHRSVAPGAAPRRRPRRRRHGDRP